MDEIRKRRLESLLQEKVSSLILRGEIKNLGDDTFLSITLVRISNDGSHAKLYVSSLRGIPQSKKGAEALNRAAGFIQQQMGKVLTMRHTPKLSFFYDDSLEYSVEINKKIDQLNENKSDD